MIEIQMRMPAARFRSIAAIAVLTGSGIACVDGLLVTPAKSRPTQLVVSYSIGAAGAARGAGEAFDAADRLHVQIVRETAQSVDITRPFAATGTVTQVAIEVDVTEAEEPAALIFELSRGADVLFAGITAVTLKRGETQNVEMQLLPVPAGVRIPSTVRTLTSIGDTVTLQAAIVFATGDTIPGLIPVWSSGNTAVADVSVLGRVTARGAGQTQIRADFGSFSASVGVVVQLSTGSIVGSVVDATNGRGLAGATIGLAAGPNAPAGATLLVSTTTQSDGSFSLSANAGQYTLLARATGFIEGRLAGVTLLGGQQLIYQVALSPTIVGGQTRIVLTWGATPFDLDAHLTGPTSQGVPFHVYYGATGSLNSPPFANLDTDDRDGLGPETITITQQFPGVYRFSVNDFTNQGVPGSTALGASGATVTIFQAGGQVAQFRVPAGQGTLWTVFQMNGSAITAINTLSFNFPPGNAAAVPAGIRPTKKPVLGR